MTASVTSLRTDTARVALIRVVEMTDDQHAEVRVTLRWEGREHVGTSTGTPAHADRPALVAAATLDAVAALEGEFQLVDATPAWAGGHDVALVVVADPEEERTLVGTALLEGDNRQIAFARATLDAVNRSLGR